MNARALLLRPASGFVEINKPQAGHGLEVGIERPDQTPRFSRQGTDQQITEAEALAGCARDVHPAVDQPPSVVGRVEDGKRGK